MKNLKFLSITLAVLGVALTTLLVGWFGAGRVTDAILSVGWAGFALFALAQLATMALLGVAWWVIMPPGSARLAALLGGRMVRDAAGSCLPFSQVGGFVLGARAAVLGGVGAALASLSTVVDLTAEFVAEILFLVIGLFILLHKTQDMTLIGPLEIGVGVSVLVAGLALYGQRRGATLFMRFGRSLLRRWFTSGDAAIPLADHELEALYSHGGRLALGTFLHLLGWCAKGAGTWIAFLLLGADIDLATAFSVEALLHAMLAVAFFVPGYAGVQEVGYVGLGALFGLGPDICLSASLLRRARDLAIGLPILLTWQWAEMHRLQRQTSRP